MKPLSTILITAIAGLLTGCDQKNPIDERIDRMVLLETNRRKIEGYTPRKSTEDNWKTGDPDIKDPAGWLDQLILGGTFTTPPADTEARLLEYAPDLQKFQLKDLRHNRLDHTPILVITVNNGRITSLYNE